MHQHIYSKLFNKGHIAMETLDKGFQAQKGFLGGSIKLGEGAFVVRRIGVAGGEERRGRRGWGEERERERRGRKESSLHFVNFFYFLYKFVKVSSHFCIK